MNLRQNPSFPPIIAPLLLLLMIGVRNNTGGKTLNFDVIKKLLTQRRVGEGERGGRYTESREGLYNAQSLIRRAGEREVANSSLYTVWLAVAVGMTGKCDLLRSLSRVRERWGSESHQLEDIKRNECDIKSIQLTCTVLFNKIYGFSIRIFQEV